ncbi:hypothetical protein [Bradyrhizobium sp. BR 10289]|uniref:hypothetical protein n=1 Tax=Bradyrhizobium sp. BR 10289 TaxID=2749993 RepID=UPI001C64C186|nr:hypothetical protein [Bradyrhizobium sp. BR 10289]MBW7970947.1 hypothetical protein [Bradyrhizobium sp. BR 10289]
MTPDQLATFQSMLGYTRNNTTPQAAAATGSALQTAGTNATTGALSGLSAYDPTKLNNTSTITDAAKAYADGQDITAQTKAATNGAMEQARDVTLPGIDQNAAMSGNTNSSRTGIADGLVQRSLAENYQNTYNDLYSKAYQNGLNLASSNANANNTEKLGALTGAASAGTNAANSGVNAGSSAINDQGNLYSMATSAGAGERAGNQSYLDNLLQRYQSQVSSPYAALNGLMGIIGTNNWGSNGTSTTTKTPSAWDIVGGLLGAAGGAASTAGGLGWKPFA